MLGKTHFYASTGLSREELWDTMGQFKNLVYLVILVNRKHWYSSRNVGNNPMIYKSNLHFNYVPQFILENIGRKKGTHLSYKT